MHITMSKYLKLNLHCKLDVSMNGALATVPFANLHRLCFWSASSLTNTAEVTEMAARKQQVRKHGHGCTSCLDTTLVATSLIYLRHLHRLYVVWDANLFNIPFMLKLLGTAIFLILLFKFYPSRNVSLCVNNVASHLVR